MAAQQKSIEAFLEAANEAAKVILETVKKDGFILVFSHLDADGVAAAGIMGKMLNRLDARCRIRVMQWVDEKIIGEVIAIPIAGALSRTPGIGPRWRSPRTRR